MRIPLTPYGAREIVFFLLAASGLAIGGWVFEAQLSWAPLAGMGAALFLAAFTLWFFRDPERRPPPGEHLAVSPADGVVDDIEHLPHHEFFAGPALKIGIFLSPLNVHVNRMPLSGEVEIVRFTKGKFKPATDPKCAHVNEQSFVGFRGLGGYQGRFAIRQITGAVARRIVCPARAGQRFERGARLGMIKFGSRTELFLPAHPEVKVLVEKGTVVRGGQSVLAEVPATTRAPLVSPPPSAVQVRHG